jgi:hypothetical protein
VLAIAGHLTVGHLGAGARQHRGAGASGPARFAGTLQIAAPKLAGQADGEAGSAGHQGHVEGCGGDVQQVLLGQGVDHGVAHTSLR